jgi:hypothetical protein
MKLNFWQWLGLILLIGGVGFWLYERSGTSAGPQNPPAPAGLTTRPAP